MLIALSLDLVIGTLFSIEFIQCGKCRCIEARRKLSYSSPTFTPALVIKLACSDEVAVSFRNVALRRDGQENVLSDVSFDVPRGTTFAIVGPTGAGKSTIIKLLAGLFPPTSGSIEVNGSTINYGKSAATYKIGVVPQDIVLFNDTMGFNIGLGKPGASVDEITDAANHACLGDLIERLPDGLQTMVGNQGLRLSGGERQRVAIARVLLANPDVILCDEATSSLDVLTEAKIVTDLMNAADGKTILLVAHRYASIQSADNVIVIEAGRITEQGTPAQLAASDGWFAEMVKRNQISA
jgi:ATP-binding cassette subfamily B protein